LRHHLAVPRTLQDFLGARHVAVVGATERSFAGTIVQRNLRHHGFDGRISQVHPRNVEVDGEPCAPSLSDLDAAPDIAVLLAPARTLPDVLREAEAVGVGWAVIPGAGEADAGDDAHRLAAFLAEPQREIRVIGPNCMGFVAPPEHLTPYIGTCPRSLRTGTVAVLSQSGAVIEAFATQGPRIGYRLLASTGNEAHVTTEEVLEHLLDEGRTEVFLLSQEGVSDPPRYFALLGRAADQGVRVGVVRVGRSAISRAAALTHTGAITGDWDLWARLARRQGAAVLETLDELHEFGALAQAPARPRSRRIWAVTNSGGQGSQIADVLAAFPHVALPQPDAAHLADFAAAFPRAGRPANPQDLWGLAPWHEAYPAGYRLIAEHGGGGTLLVACDAAPDQGDFEGEMTAGLVRTAREAVAGDERFRVVHHAPLAAPAHPHLQAELDRGGTPSVRGAAGLRALASLVAPAGPGLDAGELAAMVERPTDAPRLDHAAALALLARHGVPVPRTVVAASPEEAAAAAQGFRAPLVVKAVGPAHRAAVGGVALGLHPDDVGAVAARMAAIPGCRGYELAEQVPADLELLVHVALDAQLGPRATLGVGGALSEQAGLAVCDLAPRTLDDARRLLGRTLGERPARRDWWDVVSAILVALGDAVRDGEAVEIELNPLAVDRLGARAVAVDVLARGGQ
jgi:acyl-CoA synthetase (NDP forming)